MQASEYFSNFLASMYDGIIRVTHINHNPGTDATSWANIRDDTNVFPCSLNCKLFEIFCKRLFPLKLMLTVKYSINIWMNGWINEWMNEWMSFFHPETDLICRTE